MSSEMTSQLVTDALGFGRDPNRLLDSTAPATPLRSRPSSRAPGIAAPPQSDLRSPYSSIMHARELRGFWSPYVLLNPK